MSREIIVDAIRNMGRKEYGLNGDQPNFQLRRELAFRLSVASFRRLGLLGALNEEFTGDIPLSVVSSFPDAFGQPLLHLDHFRPYDPLYQKWVAREEEIEEQIRLKSHSKGKEVLIGHGGEPIEQGNRASYRKKPRQYYTISKFAYRRPLEDISEEEDRDLNTMFNFFIKPSDMTCYLFGGYDALPLLMMLGRVGESGTAYYITSEPQLEEQLYDSIIRRTRFFRQIKGLDITDKNILPQRLVKKFIDYFTFPFNNDLEFYDRGYPLQEVRGLSDGFYRIHRLFPLNRSIPPFPQEIRSGSVDVVVERDRFAGVDEARKEELLWEIDRVLRPGGKILLQEGCREQAEIEYYGQELFSRGYERWFPPKGVKHTARWMVFHKLTQRDQANGPSLEDFINEITIAHQGSQEPLSLSWFKRRGLLPILIAEFGGSVEEAVRFALPHVEEAVESSDEEQDLSEIPVSLTIDGIEVREPKGSKLYYTLEDLAGEFDMNKGVVLKALERAGLKSLRHRSFSHMEVRRSQMRFTPRGYEIAKEMLRQNLQGVAAKERRNNG